ncbi:hypothetical protein RND71_040847 [Anisodus tanguticus]|uniref:Uncharacterized protein n=1 Tax=Anisodus tanguticus TaxID=243964 RepID=A0AAE1UW43_9SOLA|nr:hypothetical protein RND71_040847 [Anisodus tanguticus]
MVPCLDKRNRVSFHLDFSLHKIFWVDTGQERNIPGFLLSKSREHAIEGNYGECSEKLLKVTPSSHQIFGTTSPYIVFNPGPYLDCGAFPFDDVLNHLLVSLCVQTVQPRLPCPLPKPPFPALLLEFLAQVAQYVEISKELDFDGLVIIIEDDSNTNAHLVAAHFSIKLQPAEAVIAAMLQEWKVLEVRSEYKVMLQAVHPTGYTFYAVIEMVELVARHRLRHGLVARKRFGGERASKTIHQYFKVDNFSFDGSEHITGYCLYHISSASGASFDPSSTLDEILGIPLS